MSEKRKLDIFSNREGSIVASLLTKIVGTS